MVELKKEDRPDILGGLVIKVKTGCGNLYCQLTWCHGRLFEVFANLGKSGGCASCQTQAITRLVTSGLRSGMPADECIDQLRGLQCPTPVMWPRSHRSLSCPDAIANTMIKYGKLSVDEVIGLILQANDMEITAGTKESIKEDEVDEAVTKLREQRKKDGLYDEESDNMEENAHVSNEPIPGSSTAKRSAEEGVDNAGDK